MFACILLQDLAEIDTLTKPCLQGHIVLVIQQLCQTCAPKALIKYRHHIGYFQHICKQRITRDTAAVVMGRYRLKGLVWQFVLQPANGKQTVLPPVVLSGKIIEIVAEPDQFPKVKISRIEQGQFAHQIGNQLRMQRTCARS